MMYTWVDAGGAMWWLVACAAGVVEVAEVDGVDETSPVDEEAEPADPEVDVGTDVEADPPVDEPDAYETCFADILGDGTDPRPDYSSFDLTVAEHCGGTDQQDIAGVERVVFLGDSVTVGTPPALPGDWYRNRLAGELAAEFGLEPPGFWWEAVDPIAGVSLVQESGDFASCAKWGARTRDLQGQLDDCLPASARDRRTLVVITIGGNDLAALAQGIADDRPVDELWRDTEAFMADAREAVQWLTDPGRFPAGVFVVFTNLYEFTDATGDVTACPTAGLVGYAEAVSDPELGAMVLWSMEEFASIASDHQVDMLFLLESFCGHGYNHDDPDGRCYRGPDADLWFDVTCIHPNERGHEEIAGMFMDVVRQ